MSKFFVILLCYQYIRKVTRYLTPCGRYQLISVTYNGQYQAGAYAYLVLDALTNFGSR